MGYVVLRFSYEDVMFRLADVVALVVAVHASAADSGHNGAHGAAEPTRSPHTCPSAPVVSHGQRQARER